MYERAKAIVVERPGRAVVRDIAVTPVDDQTIVVKTVYSAISTGTEMKVWSGRTGALDGALWYPLVPGYEEVGEIVHVGRRVKGFKVGDRVMANEVRQYPDHCAAWGGQCELAVKNRRTASGCFDGVAKIPDRVSYQEAVIAYLAAVAKKGIDKVAPRPDETVLVIGMGMVGLSALQLAKLIGCRVIAAEIHPGRLKLARSFTDETIDARKQDVVRALGKLTDGRMADVIIECSGNPAVVPELNKYLREGGWDRDDDGGRIHLQGDYPAPLIIHPYQNWFTKNPRISLTCAIRPGGKEEILELIARRRFDTRTILDSSLVREVPVGRAPRAYEQLARANGDILKVLLRW